MTSTADPMVQLVTDMKENADNAAPLMTFAEAQAQSGPHAPALNADQPKPKPKAKGKAKAKADDPLRTVKDTADALYAVNRVKHQREDAERKRMEAGQKVLKQIGESKMKEAKQAELKDDMATHMAYMTTINKYRQILGCVGTGKRINMDSPIQTKYAEVETMKDEMKLRRGQSIMNSAIPKIIDGIEKGLESTYQDIRGFSAQWQRHVDEDEMLQQALDEFAIQWGSSLGCRYDVYIAGSIYMCAQQTIAANKERRMGSAPLPRELNRDEYAGL